MEKFTTKSQKYLFLNIYLLYDVLYFLVKMHLFKIFPTCVQILPTKYTTKLTFEYTFCKNRFISLVFSVH
jgi:hypothetical protein